MSKRYLAQLRSDLNRFAEFFRCPILHVKSEQIDEWLRSLKVAPRTRNGTLTSVRTLFSFAKSRSYLPKNEITEADALNKSKVGDTDTVIFEPAVMRKLLNAASPQLIPFLAIGAFAGLRSAEIARLEWSAINFERGIIEIRAGQAKTASRRIVPVSDNLRAWIESLARKGPVIHTPELYRDVSALAAKLGIEWPRNVLRHSYISYRLPIVKMPVTDRSLVLELVLDGAYYTNLLGDDVVAKGFVPQVVQPGIMDAMIRRLAGFDLHETVILPENGEKLIGFAAHPSGMAVAMRYLVPAANYDEAGAITDPETGLTFGYLRYGEVQSNRVFVTVECLYGFKTALADGIKRIVGV
ncbi:MAG: tyrosine-type recombinase/integrase [Chthoniobacteraceae bacterium]